MENDLTGKRFGKLVVIKRDTERKDRAFWICKCDCGNTKSMYGANLISKSKSCGCSQNERLQKFF